MPQQTTVTHVVTTNTLVGGSVLYSVHVTLNAAASGTVMIHDGTSSASGTKYRATVHGSGGTLGNRNDHGYFQGARFSTGIFVQIIGTPSVTVETG